MDDGQDPPHHSAVGAELRAAREAEGLSLADIAERTRVPLRHLAAIEAGNYPVLPAATYSTGFVRTYARLLGLDAADLSQRFRAELAEQEPQHSRFQEAFEPADPARVPSRGIALAAVLLAVLLGLGYLYWRGSRSEEPAALATREAAAPAPAAVPRAAPAAVVTPPAAPSPETTALLTAEQPAWVRITDAGGTKLFQGVLNPGDRFQVPATATDPRLRTSRVTALKVTVGTTTIPPLGPPETLVKDVSLKPDALLARVAATPATTP